MDTSITPEHAAHNEKRLTESQQLWLDEERFEDPISGNNGWIEPDGTLRACPYECHSDFCDSWYGQPELEIEDTHVKLSDGWAWFYGKQLTKAQAGTLLDYGYDPKKFLDGKDGGVQRGQP